ncbi:MAG: mannose-1-phosphate guanylyltransferase [Myxococcaceae bacterium]
MNSKLYGVIMAGGSGTRFWPLSRKARPKQFLALATKRTMIEETLARLNGLSNPKDCFVVCGALHANPVKKLLKKLPAKNVLVEPEARNTAPAIALAAAHVAARDPNGLVAVLPSDQHVSDVPGFQKAVELAAAVAEQGYIVTLGIKPSRPETGYGYIRVGEPLPSGGCRVAAFVEKPNLETAQQYMVSGEYLWNAGIFIFKASTMLEAFQAHMPELSAATAEIQAAVGTKKEAAVLKRAWKKMPSQSIDYGVAEKAQNIAVVPGDFGWSDVGSFAALPEVRAKDAGGNVVEGPALVIDSQGCVVVASKKPLAVVGMKDVVAVDAGDAILVLPREKSQDVRKVVEALKANKKLAQYL